MNETISPAANPKQALIDMAHKIVPNADRIYIVPEEKEKVTKSGIARSQTAKGEDETEVGTIVAIGADYTSEYGIKMPMRYHVEDRVIMDRYAGVRFRMDIKGKFLPQHVDVRDDLLPIRIVRQDAILGRLPNDWPV